MVLNVQAIKARPSTGSVLESGLAGGRQCFMTAKDTPSSTAMAIV
jgi:hypothetical protein